VATSWTGELPWGTITVNPLVSAWNVVSSRSSAAVIVSVPGEAPAPSPDDALELPLLVELPLPDALLAELELLPLVAPLHRSGPGSAWVPAPEADTKTMYRVTGPLALVVPPAPPVPGAPVCSSTSTKTGPPLSSTLLWAGTSRNVGYASG
jgi:hypothetical protein